MTIELPEDLSEALRDLAQRRANTPHELAERLLREALGQVSASLTDTAFHARAEALRGRMAEGARQVRDEVAAEKLAARILGEGGGAD